MLLPHSLVGGLATILVISLISSPTALAVPTNVTVDDTSPEIQYVGGGWTRAHGGTDGGYSYTTNPNASYASLRFNATNVYYIAPKWPFRVKVLIRFDVGAESPGLAATLDLQDLQYNGPPTSDTTVDPSIIAGFALPPTNGMHTMDISFVPGDLGGLIVVDSLILTIDDDGPSSDSPSPSTSGSPTETNKAGEGKSALPTTTGAAIGGVLGGVGVLLVSGLVWFCLKRRRAQKRSRYNTPMIIDGVEPPPNRSYGSPDPQWTSAGSPSSASNDLLLSYGDGSPVSGNLITMSPIPSSIHRMSSPPPQYELVAGESVSRNTSQVEKKTATIPVVLSVQNIHPANERLP